MQIIADNHWRVNTNDYSAEHKQAAWEAAMQELFLSVDCAEKECLDGEVTYFKSHMGVDFVNLIGSPQTLTGNYTEASESLWIAILIEGEASLEINRDHLSFKAGHILYGSCSNIDHICLKMQTHFRLLTIEIPHTAFYKRLVNPLAIRAGVITCQMGISKILSVFLQAISEQMDSMTSRAFRALDIALTELFLNSLGESISLNNFSNHANAHAYQRICDSIEAHLSDELMNLHTISQINGVSERYIQKLFQEAGLKFNHYVRDRRIDLCKRDLANLNYQNLSISEICYRWGFNDLAYFSRVFSKQIGVSPRTYREQVKK